MTISCLFVGKCQGLEYKKTISIHLFDHPPGDKEVGRRPGHTGAQSGHRNAVGAPPGHHREAPGDPTGHRRATAEHRSRETFVLISLWHRRDHFSRPPRQLRLARSHHERNETISRSGDSVPLRSHPSPTSDLVKAANIVAPSAGHERHGHFLKRTMSVDTCVTPGSKEVTTLASRGDDPELTSTS